MVKRKKAPRTVELPQTKSPIINDRSMEYLIVGLILIAASVLILSNLGDCYLWGDEAQTALVSRTILTHGLPMGYDGKNYFSVTFGAEYGDNFVWRWHPWLPFYVLALFFKLLGTSTLIARLPFALFGIVTVLIAYLFGKSLWNSRRAGLLSAVLLMTSVPMLLLVRQCRYYSMVTFFCLAGLYAYHQMLQGRRYSGAAFFVCAFLLFHSLYVYLAALLGTVLIHSFIFHRDRFKQVFLFSAAVTVVNIPWLIFFSGVAGDYTKSQPLVIRAEGTLMYLLQQTVKNLLPSWPVLLGLVLVLIVLPRIRKMSLRDTTTLDSLCLVGLFIFVTIVVLAFTARPFFRYVAPIIPMVCLLIALLLDIAMRLHPAVGLVAVAVIVFQGRMLEYVYELSHDFSGPIEGIVQYLNEHGKDTDVVAVNHEPLPIMFYTDMTVVSGTSGQDFGPAKDANWIVARQGYLPMEGPLAHYIEKNWDQSKYVMIRLDAPDTFDQNRESPTAHYFRTQSDEPDVILYKRTSR